MGDQPLKGKMELFCQEFLVDLNGTQAAIRAGYSQKTAGRIAAENVSKPVIAARIAHLQANRGKSLAIEQADVLRRWIDIATADPTKVTMQRVGSCRYCHGTNGLYQWKTPREFQESSILAAAKRKKTADQEQLDAALIGDEGGYGYRVTSAPNPACGECSGLGVPYTHFADTSTLTGKEKLLFRSVKRTRDGIEFKLADQDEALANIAKHLGMLKGVIDIAPTDALMDLIASVQGRSLPVASGGGS